MTATDKQAFTPGPWEAREDGIVWKRGEQFGFIPLISPWREDAFDGDPEALANAHLIAAAPDLYEALKWIRSCYRPDNGSDMIAAVDAALAKARGEDA